MAGTNRLVRQVSSQYIEAANRLKPKSVAKRIVAYVESYDDVAFWRLLLDEFESDGVRFQIMLPSNTASKSKGQEGIVRGKKSALRQCVDERRLGGSMIACVDSDYDYLLQGATGTSRQMNDSPYVLQTYAYAIENYLCYAGSLRQIMVQCTLNDNEPIDFEAFMQAYSEILFPLFAWNIWFYRHGRHSQFSIQEFNAVSTIETVSVHNPHKVLDCLAQKVRNKLAWLEASYSSAVTEVDALKAELQSLGVRPDNTYLFMQGHHLMDTVIPRLMKPVINSLQAERETELHSQARHQMQLQNELQAYRHSTTSLEEALRKNTHYRDCELYQKMRAAVSRLLKLDTTLSRERQSLL